MSVQAVIKKHTFYDSVVLMNASLRLREHPGVKEALVVMGTENNKEMLRDLGLLTDEAREASASDLIVAFSLAIVASWSAPALAGASAQHQELCGCKRGTQAATSFKRKPKPGTKAVCPVMKQSFTVHAKSELSYYKGRWYAFCCPGCKPKFDKNPSQYAGR